MECRPIFQSNYGWSRGIPRWVNMNMLKMMIEMIEKYHACCYISILHAGFMAANKLMAGL